MRDGVVFLSAAGGCNSKEEEEEEEEEGDLWLGHLVGVGNKMVDWVGN